MSSGPICWDFSDREDPSIPVAPIFLCNPQKEDREWHEISLKVDTGFGGAIGLPQEIIQALQLAPLGQILITTAAGEKRVPYFQIFVRNEQWGLGESLAYAIETTRALGGRSLLVGRRWLLDFEAQQFCYLSPREEE